MNNAAGRQFVNYSADDARAHGAPMIARTLEALNALANGLASASRHAPHQETGQQDGQRRPVDDAWWGKGVLAPSRGLIQRYPPGALYAEHVDTYFTGDGWASPRSFTAIVYAHSGWMPGEHGGELSVHPKEDLPGRRRAVTGPQQPGPASATVVEPRGGTLVLFPSHLVHSVAQVQHCPRYAVTTWLSLQDRTMDAAVDDAVGQSPSAAAAGVVGPDLSTRQLAHQLRSEEWVQVCSGYDPILKGIDGHGLRPGTLVANFIVDEAQRDACLATLAGGPRTSHESEATRRV